MGKAAGWLRRLLKRWCFATSSTPPKTHLSSEHAQVKASVFQAHVSSSEQAHVSSEHAQVKGFKAGAQVSNEREAHFKGHKEDGAQVKKKGYKIKESGAHVREERAAVTIQAHFRSYLARRALRALKSLVKLQALVRGHIMRKQTLHRMHSLLRVQARARAGRAQISDSLSSSAKSSQFCHPGPATPEKFENIIRSDSARRDHSPILKRNSSKSASRMINALDNQQNDWYWSGHIKGRSAKNGYADNEKSDKIVEIDSFKSHLMPKKKNLSSDQYSHSFSTSKDSTTHQTLPSPSSYEVRSFSPLKAPQDLDESPFCTAHNSPQFYSASSRSRKSIFTPTKSDGSRSYLSGYSDHPNYMACTESSKAKTRSVSAPRQRTQMERSGSARRYLVYNYEESKINSQKGSEIHASFVNKAYPGSGRLDRLGLPVIYNGYLNGY